jgi:tetratricopeptide (TPR) repeat protein
MGAHVLLVRGLLARGELDLAASELKQLRARFPNAPVVHTQTGLLLARRSDTTGAGKEFERALALNPDELEALGGLVALDLDRRDFATARNRLNDRLQVRRDAATLTIAARVESVSGNRESADRLLREAIDRDHSYIPAYRLLGQQYVAARQFAAAQAEFEKAAAQSPKPVAELTMIGILLQAQDKRTEARRQFERALQFDPDAAVAANNLAWMYAESDGNLNEALRLAKTAQKHLPASPEVNDTVGYLYTKLRLAKLAVATLKLAVDEDPANALYRYHLGLAYASAGDRRHADESLKRALALNPDLVGAKEAASRLASTDSTP